MANETVLNTSNVNGASFGKAATRFVDGQIYAQPLYAQAVTVSKKKTANIIYVATMHNSVYAFDADNSGAAPYWQRNLGASVPRTTGYIVPEIGILSTPVLDMSSGILFVVAATSESGTIVHRLHALDMVHLNGAMPGLIHDGPLRCSSNRGAGSVSGPQ